MQSLSGRITDKLSGKLRDDAPEWAPERPGDPVPTECVCSEGRSIEGRRLRKLGESKQL